MSDLITKVLDKIKEERLAPEPRWKFLLRAYLPWALFGLFIIIGAIAVSVAIFIITDHDWDIYGRLQKSFLEYLLISLPYFWFVFLVVFFGMAWYELRGTKHGYRYGIMKIGLINVLASVILGVVFFYSGIGLKIEGVFADNLPFYRNMQSMRPPKVWDNPERGLLIGEITIINEDQSFNIRDFGGHNWLISCIKCLWRTGSLPHNEGMIVKIIGQETGKGVFEALEIRPMDDACANPGSPSLVKRGCRPMPPR
jgi:hypothetical protein